MKFKRIQAMDQDWLARFWHERWGGGFIIIHGQTFFPEMVDGVLALEDGKVVGLITFSIDGVNSEVVSLDSLIENRGIGSTLLGIAVQIARQRGCKRLSLVTTNDNLRGLGFYQKRGFRLCALHAGAVDESRKQKPGIPLIGENDIPIHDELELEFELIQRLNGEMELDIE